MCRENKDCEETVEQTHGLNVVARRLPAQVSLYAFPALGLLVGAGPLLDYVGSPMQSMGKSAIDIHS